MSARIGSRGDGAHTRGDLSSTFERVLVAIGLEPSLVETVVGDLTEEYASHVMEHGVARARLAYLGECASAVPHLIVSTLRRGAPRARVRLIATLAGVWIIPAGVAAAITMFRDGPPARLMPDIGDATDGIVVNNERPVRLTMRAADERGHELASNGVRYRWMSGAPIGITASGDITCTQRGDAIVRATLGGASTNVDVHCRPVKTLHASGWIDFIAGDPPRDLPFVAVGVDGEPVTHLRGSVNVPDSSVARIVGTTIQPRAVGQTTISVRVGDVSTAMRVLVHEPVASLQNLRSDQRLVAKSVRMVRGDTLTFPLPSGVYWLKFLPRHDGEGPPTITVNGDIFCFLSDGIRGYELPREEFANYCTAGPRGAVVILAHGKHGSPVVEGAIALERIQYK